MTAASAFIALALKTHCRQLGWTTPDQYSTACYSEFPNAFTNKNLGELFPYLSKGASFDHGPIQGWAAGFATWLTSSSGDGALRRLAFFDVNAFFIAAVWIFTVIIVARTAGRRPWDAAIIAASPLLLLTAFISWDFWAAGLVALGIFLFSRKKALWAGFVLGIAVMAAPYALMVLLAVLVLGIRSRKATAALEVVAAAVVGFAVVLVPVMTNNPSGWGSYLKGMLEKSPTESSLFGAWNALAGTVNAPVLGIGTINILTAFLLAIVVLGVLTLGLYSPEKPRLAQLAAVGVAGFLLVSKFSEPWQAVWLLPLLALALPRWRPLLLWQAAMITSVISLLLYRSKVLGKINAQHAIDAPFFALAVIISLAATAAIIGLLVRDVLHAKFDAVRRGGIEDPQAGIFAESAEVATGADASKALWPGRHSKAADPVVDVPEPASSGTNNG